MRDDTYYSDFTIGHDRKYLREQDAIAQRPRAKPLERSHTWELAIGVGCFTLIVLGVLAFVAGVALGYINVM